MADVGQELCLRLLGRLGLHTGIHEHGLCQLLCRVVHHRAHQPHADPLFVADDEPAGEEGLVGAILTAESIVALVQRLVRVADRLVKALEDRVPVIGVQAGLPPGVIVVGAVGVPQDLLDGAGPQRRAGEQVGVPDDVVRRQHDQAMSRFALLERRQRRGVVRTDHGDHLGLAVTRGAIPWGWRRESSARRRMGVQLLGVPLLPVQRPVLHGPTSSTLGSPGQQLCPVLRSPGGCRRRGHLGKGDTCNITAVAPMSQDSAEMQLSRAEPVSRS